MIDADAELNTLEQEFPKSSRVWATDTDAVLDQRILYIADAAAHHLAQKYREERDLTSVWSGRGFPRPTLGEDATPEEFLRSERAMESSMPYDMLSAASMRSLDYKRANIPPGAEKMLAFLEDAERKVWLDRIADIVKAGDVELAIYLLSHYRMKFEGE